MRFDCCIPKSSFFPAQTVPRHMASFASYRLLAPSAPIPMFLVKERYLTRCVLLYSITDCSILSSWWSIPWKYSWWIHLFRGTLDPSTWELLSVTTTPFLAGLLTTSPLIKVTPCNWVMLLGLKPQTTLYWFYSYGLAWLVDDHLMKSSSFNTPLLEWWNKPINNWWIG